MRLIDQTELKMEWADANSRVRHPFPEPHPRSPGIHLSGVLRHVALESGILAKEFAVSGEPRNVESTRKGGGAPGVDVDEEIMPLRMIFGMFFEEGAVGLYPHMTWQPGELERDGVFGTMDGYSLISCGDGRWQVEIEEFKLTWKSEWNYGKSAFCSANWMWMNQAKGYLALAQHNYWPVNLRVRFHVGWVNGDYRPPAPKLIRYLVEFTQAEVDNTWRMVQRNMHKKGVKREG